MIHTWLPLPGVGVARAGFADHADAAAGPQLDVHDDGVVGNGIELLDRLGSAAARPVTLNAAYCEIMLSRRLRSSGESSTSRIRSGLPGDAVGSQRVSSSSWRLESADVPEAGCNDGGIASSVAPWASGTEAIYWTRLFRSA